MMKRVLIPVLAIAAASVAVPVIAQDHGRQDRDRYERNDRDDHDRYERNDRDDHGRYERNDRDDHDRYDRNDRDDRRDRAHRYENHGRWQSIAQRKYQLDRRIEVGLRNGSLSRREASRLQIQLNSLVRLERNYMRAGLTRWERSDLDPPYDRLAVQVHIERRDRDNRRW